MSIRLAIHGGYDDRESVETESTDDFYYFRNGVHATLETGAFGSRFPLLLSRFEPSQWAAEEVEVLQRELEAIADEFKKLPPQPPDSHWRGKLARSGRQCATLFDVYVDARNQPLLGRLIDLCAAARGARKPITME